MNDIRNITIIALAALLSAAIGFGVYQTNNLTRAEAIANNNQLMVHQAATIVNRHIDTANRKYTVNFPDNNDLQPDRYKNGTAIKGGLVDTVASALQIAKKQLWSAIQIASTQRAEKSKAVKRSDSLQQLACYYKDKYLQLAVHSALVGDSTDNWYGDEIAAAQYRKMKRYLNAKKNYVDTFSIDSRRITEKLSVF